VGAVKELEGDEAPGQVVRHVTIAAVEVADDYCLSSAVWERGDPWRQTGTSSKNGAHQQAGGGSESFMTEGREAVHKKASRVLGRSRDRKFEGSPGLR
jgi:hypothetical protein